MSIARTVTRPGQTSQLILVTAPNTRLTPAMVKKARRGSELVAIISAAEKELKPIKAAFDRHFIATGTLEGTDASGTVLVRRTHGEPNVLDQTALRERYPKEAAECTWPHPWDSVGFAGFR